MTNSKRVFTSSDAAPSVLYVKKDVASGKAYPLLAGTFGFSLPNFDEIALSYTGTNLTGVEYRKDSVSTSTLTLAYSGSTLTGVVQT